MKKKTFSVEELIVHLYEAQEFIGNTMDAEEGDIGHDHMVGMIYAIGQAIVQIESQKEVRVYAVDDSLLEKSAHLYSNEEFIALSEEDGNVWSLDGFQRDCNSGDLFLDNYTIRFI
jgi:hypothetical protein